MSLKLKSKAQEDTATGNNVGMMLMSSCNKAYQNRVIRFFFFLISKQKNILTASIKKCTKVHMTCTRAPRQGEKIEYKR